MGLLVDGKWKDQWYDTDSSEGRFERSAAAFRNWVTADGSAGPDGKDGFKAEADRYRLYVSLACPWAHRTLIFRKLKSLEKLIAVDVVHPLMLENGWELRDQNGNSSDSLFQADFLHQIYTRAKSDYSGRVTVPVLWDKKHNTIVSNESADIIRMFNSAFDGLTGNSLDFYPEALRADIDEVNDYVYDRVNNGVYKAGFSTTQEAYEEAFDALFRCLDTLEKRLSTQRYLVGSTLTEADWRLFTTLLRFDAVYHGHFKCNLRRIADYPALRGYLRELYQMPGVRDTVNFEHIKGHYYGSHRMINGSGIVPKGPKLDLDAAHQRDSI